MRQPGEPSVEDILASIKQVMARDHRGGGEPGATPADGAPERAAPGPALDDHDEPVPVLELTDAEMEAAPPAGPPPPDASGDKATGAGEARLDRAAPPPAARTLPPPPEQAAQASLRDLLSALAVLADRGAPTRGVPPGETSLEALARELMRPMIAEWLDANLPPMVERLAAAELARIVGQRG